MQNLTIDPPLLNSSSPWATTLADLKALYTNPSTGAITTRTSTIGGFNDDPTIHQHCFFDAGKSAAKRSSIRDLHTKSEPSASAASSLNTYGYSPFPLSQYLMWIEQLVSIQEGNDVKPKLIIVSVTGPPEDIVTAYTTVHELAGRLDIHLAVEINLSCPNIAGRPPPAYDTASLTTYLDALATVVAKLKHAKATVYTGVKVPPYTYADQFSGLVDCLVEYPLDFVTSTNTLGSCLVLDDANSPALSSESGTGIGGFAGAGVHALSLGNVATLRRLLDLHDTTKGILVIGVGGVSDRAGFERMRSVGAGAVGVATALGRFGVDVFGKIIST